MDPAYWDEAAMHLQAEEAAAHWDAEDEQQEKDERLADQLERAYAIVERRRAEAGLAPISPAVRETAAPAEPSRSAQRSPTGQRAKAKPSGLTLEQIVPLWQRDRQPTAKTLDAVARAVREAKDPDIHTITRTAIIAMRDQRRAAGNSVATTNKKIGFVRLLLGVAKSRGLIEVNHAEGAELPPPKRAVELRWPYSPEQAEAVMAATEGARETDPAMYWLPRLARWTGARLNELHQLRREDLQTREGIPGLMITDEGEHAEGAAMRLKNAGSRRWVPLAKPVREFAEWVQERQDGPLFPAKADCTASYLPLSQSATGDCCVMPSRSRTSASPSIRGGTGLPICAGDKNAPAFDMEIIEVGAVWIAPDGTILDRFQSFARPMVNPMLTPFCSALTGICQADLDAAPEFPAVAEALRAFVARHQQAGSIWASWGALHLQPPEGPQTHQRPKRGRCGIL